MRGSSASPRERISPTTATLKTNEKGIQRIYAGGGDTSLRHELGDGRVAWFKDPDGNIFAAEQEENR